MAKVRAISLRLPGFFLPCLHSCVWWRSPVPVIPSKTSRTWGRYVVSRWKRFRYFVTSVLSSCLSSTSSNRRGKRELVRSASTHTQQSLARSSRSFCYFTWIGKWRCSCVRAWSGFNHESLSRSVSVFSARLHYINSLYSFGHSLNTDEWPMLPRCSSEWKMARNSLILAIECWALEQLMGSINDNRRLVLLFQGLLLF